MQFHADTALPSCPIHPLLASHTPVNAYTASGPYLATPISPLTPWARAHAWPACASPRRGATPRACASGSGGSCAAASKWRRRRHRLRQRLIRTGLALLIPNALADAASTISGPRLADRSRASSHRSRPPNAARICLAGPGQTASPQPEACVQGARGSEGWWLPRSSA